MEKKTEKYKLAGGKECRKVLAENPTYKVFWRSGFAFRGAGEREIKRDGLRKVWIGREYRDATFEEEMRSRYNWSAGIDIEIDHDKKEIHMNGYSENDLYC